MKPAWCNPNEAPRREPACSALGAVDNLVGRALSILCRAYLPLPRAESWERVR